MDIKNLINNKKWNKKNINEPIYENNFFIHYISLNGDEKIYNKYKNYIDLYKINNSGDTGAHIAAKLGYISLLKEMIHQNPEILNIKNNDKNTILNILSTNNNLLNYIFNKYGKYIKTINNKNNKGNTLLLSNILSQNESNIDLLLKNGADINYPKKIPPIILATLKNDLKMVKKLKENGADINIKDKYYKTAFITSVINKNKEITQYLLDNNVEYNYTGGEGDYHPINIALINKDIDMLNIFLSKDINLNQQNRFLETPAHILFKLLYNKPYKKISYEIRKKILENTHNLNKQNIKGNTILHYLFKNDNWKKYKKILSNKKLNVSLKNKNNITPLSLVKNKKELLNFVLENYKKYLNTENNLLDPTDKKCKKYLDNNIKKFNKECPIEEKDNIKILDYKYSNINKFSPTIIFNIIYTIILLKKYKTLGIPLGKIKKSDIKSKSINNILSIYNIINPKLLSYIFVWKDINNYYIPNNIKKNINKNKKFIFMRLSLIISDTLNHANVLIYDVDRNVIERFDPYGNVPYVSDDLDKTLEKTFKKIINKDIKYISPKDYINKVSFQIVSNENNEDHKKFGDPEGYCMAWSYWYIETRILNKNVDSITLINKLINKLNKQNISFIEFIRNYANNLDELKNKFLIKAGINDKDIYNNILTENTLELIKKKINKDLHI